MTVVVGVDTSETASRAAAKAARLAAGLGTDLVVVCAFSDKQSGPSVPARETSTKERALEVAGGVVEKLAQDHPDLSIDTASEEGKPAEVLLDAAREFGADVIVVGNRHAQGVSRILGSVAQDVVRKATCDVFVAYTK